MDSRIRDGRRPAERRSCGLQFEQLAVDWLEMQGLQLRQRNFSCRAGEIDLIMSSGDMLIFVEVRFRRSSRFGGPLLSVTRAKRRRLIRTAYWFLASQGHPDVPWRFDVLAISPAADGQDTDFHYQWVQCAFQE